MTAALERPRALAEALRRLDELGDDAEPLAGGTWIMRAPSRREAWKGAYVALDGIGELRRLDPPAFLGALLTHRELAPLGGALGEAARLSAFPAVRNVATLGGNVCARGFAEADLVPALLALDASVRLATVSGETGLALGDYLERRAGGLVAGVALGEPAGWRSTFERLTIRGGGEYPIVNVAVALDVVDGTIRGARVAVGAYEPVARRSPAAEAALVGTSPTAAAGLEAGRLAAAELEPRDDLAAPAWYRREVLPALVRDAVERLGSSGHGLLSAEAGLAGRSVVARSRVTLEGRGSMGETSVSPMLVNGLAYGVDDPPFAPLASVLRDGLGLTGTKVGCGEGRCGACTVLVDGLAVVSCLYPAGLAARREITTVEGLADGEASSPLQDALLEAGGVQCGACTPGVLMTLTALLAETVRPTEREVREALAGNVCRCTGYAKIVEAALAAAGSGP